MRDIHERTTARQVFWLLCLCLALPGPALAKAPLEQVTLQLRWFHQFQFAGYYAALEQGYYREAGLDVVIQERAAEQDPVEMVASGQAQYGVTNAEILLHALQGKPLVVLAAIYQHSPLVLVAKDGAGIDTPHDLIGARVKMTRHSRDVELQAMLAREGVSLDQVRLTDGEVGVADYLDPNVDALSAYVSNQPFHLAQAGMNYRILWPRQYGIDFYGDCLFTSQAELSERPDRAQAFLEASLKGWQYAMEHPEEIITLIKERYATQKSLDHLRFEAERIRELIMPEFVKIGHINPGRWRHIAEVFQDLGFIKPEPVPEQFFSGFIYDPERPSSDALHLRRWLWLLAGSLAAISLVTAVLLAFLRQKQRIIAERNRAEAALQESKRLLDIFFSQSLTGFFFMMLDEPIVWNASTDKEQALEYVFAHQRMIRVNQAMLEQYGAREEDFLGLTPEDLFQHDLEHGRRIWRKLFDQGQLHVETDERRLDGTPVAIDGDYICLYDEKGRITGHFGVQSDVTQRKQAGRELIQAKEAAEAAARAKSSFLANMSHEIRTPMNAVIGFAQLALGRKCCAQCRDYFQKISTAANSLLGVINDILDFSRVESGRLAIERTVFRLRDVLDSTQEQVQQKALDKGLELTLDVAPDVPDHLRGDSMRLRQVLLNLLGNAVKFTPRGRVSLEVRVEERRPEQVRLLFTVSDTGIGLAPEQIAGLFTPFTQADDSTTRRFGGSGLGLAISKGLVQRMRGDIGVTSVLGQGSRFFFSLPFALACGEQMAATTPGVTNVHPDFRGVRILVVEDNAMNQEVAREFLESEGIMVMVVENGQQALEILARESFDLVFMDVQMPVMDGLEATRRIRAEEDSGTVGQSDSRKEDIGQEPSRSQRPGKQRPEKQRPEKDDQTVNLDSRPSASSLQPSTLNLQPSPRLPIIAMTAHALTQAREECLAAGMDDVLTKPIQRENLLDILRTWLPAIKEDKKAVQEKTPAGRKFAETSRNTDASDALQARLPGFDVRTGLAFANHNEPLYRQLLEKFREEGRALHQALTQARTQARTDEDRERMIREAHTLKSLARMIGAGDLADAAQEMERAARARAPLDHAARRLDKAMQHALAVLDAWAGADSSVGSDWNDAVPGIAMDNEAVARLLETLRRSVRSDLKQAVQQAGRLEALVAGTDLAAAAAALKKDIFDFETDSALARLEEIAEQIERRKA